MSAPESAGPSTLTALLAERARNGDLSRFEELYARVAPALYGWTSLRIHAELRGRIDPEEIVQETWLRALAEFQKYDERRGTFRAWIFGLAKNVLLEGLHTAHRSPRSGAGTTSGFSPLEHLPDLATSATRRLARDEGLQRFLACVRELGEEEQTLMILVGLEGLSCAQAALRLGISHEAALKRWQRLRGEIVSRDLPSALLVDQASG